jgi:hypothetical protein
MTQRFFVKFMKIWKKTHLLLASKANERIITKSKIFLMIMSSLNFKMVYYIVMVFLYVHDGLTQLQVL